MKRILSLCLAILMIAAVMVSCDKKEPTLKLGLGVYTYYDKATNADADVNGKGEAVTTAAAVLLDKDNKIVKCVVDSLDVTVEYTSDGKFVAKESFQTKYEKGASYGMVAYGGATKEWFEQVDAFCALIVGKTADEVKALMVNNDKGNSDVINAGCTITISDFVYAIEKAIANAVDSEATASHTLRLGIVAEHSGSNATAEKDGKSEVEAAIVAAAVDADGKVSAISSDSVQIAFAFDAAGAAKTDVSKAIATKKDKGAAYGMAQYGQDLNGDGTVKEWHEQAAAFDAACIGKTATEIAGLKAENGYGVEALQSAGCTVAVDAMVKAAVKAATVA